MQKYIYIISILFVSFVYGQKSEGDILRKEGLIDDAIKAYKKDFLSNPSNSKNTYNLACAYALTYIQKDSAYHYLEIALKNDFSLWALADNDLISLTNDVRWKGIENHQLKKYQEKNGNIKQAEYAVQLLQLIMKDQALDYQMDLAKIYFMKNGKAPHWYYPIAQMKQDITSNNFNKMESLISQYGWPTYSMVGKLAADAPLLIINHHESDEVRKKYLDQIRNACITNESSCMEYAKIQDRILVNSNQEQIYGMQFRYNDKRILEPFPIQDPEFVDQRRSKIGLEPLKDYLKRKINYDWNVIQQEK
ncbi:MAG: DUF6624 domain-containing protein [Bacteroidota bacterium]